MGDSTTSIEWAKIHFGCAEKLMQDNPLQAANYLLTCILDATSAAPGFHAGTTDPRAVLSLIGGLHGVVSRGDPNLSGLAEYVQQASSAVADVLSDAEESCRQASALSL